jgi:hypothetical protein
MTNVTGFRLAWSGVARGGIAWAVLATGMALLEWVRRPFARRWSAIQQDIETAQRSVESS